MFVFYLTATSHYGFWIFGRTWDGLYTELRSTRLVLGNISSAVQGLKGQLLDLSHDASSHVFSSSKSTQSSSTGCRLLWFRCYICPQSPLSVTSCPQKYSDKDFELSRFTSIFLHFYLPSLQRYFHLLYSLRLLDLFWHKSQGFVLLSVGSSPSWNLKFCFFEQPTSDVGQLKLTSWALFFLEDSTDYQPHPSPTSLLLPTRTPARRVKSPRLTWHYSLWRFQNPRPCCKAAR